MLLLKPLNTLLLLLSPALSFAATKTITLDSANPTTLVEELLDHPYITYSLASAISGICHRVERIEYFLDHVNTTNLPTFVGPNGTIINVTAVILAAEADLAALSSNKTLITICRKANQIVKDCSPLVDGLGKNPRPSAIESYLDELKTHSAITLSRPSRTLVITLDPTATSLARGNATLLRLCEAWALGLGRNLTDIDAAIYAADIVTSTGSASSTTFVSSAASATATGTGTGTGTAASSATPSATGTSGAAASALISSGLLGTLGLVLLGMVLLL